MYVCTSTLSRKSNNEHKEKREKKWKKKKKKKKKTSLCTLISAAVRRSKGLAFFLLPANVVSHRKLPSLPSFFPSSLRLPNAFTMNGKDDDDDNDNDEIRV